MIRTALAILAAVALVGVTSPQAEAVTSGPDATVTLTPSQTLYRSIFDDPGTPDCLYEDGSELLD
jgi:hypothetical protein